MTVVVLLISPNEELTNPFPDVTPELNSAVNGSYAYRFGLEQHLSYTYIYTSLSLSLCIYAVYMGSVRPGLGSGHLAGGKG